MEEKIKKRIEELEGQQAQMLANLNACGGAIQELKALIGIVPEQPLQEQPLVDSPPPLLEEASIESES